VTSGRLSWRRICGARVRSSIEVTLDVALVALVGDARAVAT